MGMFSNFARRNAAALASAVGATLIGSSDGAAATLQHHLDILAKGAVSPAHKKYAGGAKYDGVTDDSAANQACLTECLATGKVMVLPVGTTLNTTQVVKAQSGLSPIIQGAGAGFTVWKYTGAGAAIKIKGGSGSLTDSYIDGVSFEGTATNYGLEVADACGFQARNCRFRVCAVGLLLHNESAGGFTEYVQAINCQFDEACKQALVYKRTGGNDSFHGSGLGLGCMINEAAASTKACVEIGGTLSTNQDIVVYNAPLNAQVWKRNAVAFLTNNSTRFVTTFHGLLTFEVFGASKFNVADGGANTFFVGAVCDFSDKAQRGKLFVLDGYTTRADGSMALRRKPYREPSKLMVAGANTIASLYAIGGETYQLTLTFTDSGSPWRRVIQVVVHNGGGNSFVTTTHDIVSYFGGNQPDPVFSMGAGNALVATQAAWPANRIYCETCITQLGFPEGSTF